MVIQDTPWYGGPVRNVFHDQKFVDEDIKRFESPF
ncbi:hypothetical protein NC651_004243 [Populus alba x Populus x berolinensis]|nr:hypothetical protein NC651_004243 [Populus alba x Populus x berolinensis]